MTDLLPMEPRYGDYMNYSRLPEDIVDFGSHTIQNSFWNASLLLNTSFFTHENRSHNDT